MSTTDVVIYDQDDKKIVFPVVSGDIWQTQENMAFLFGVTRVSITQHVNNIYKEGELDKEATRRKMPRIASDGKTYKVWYYSLDMIIAIGYRVSSSKGTQFRKWATPVLRDFIEKGHVIDKERMITQPESFSELLLEVQEIRTSEMGMYQKMITTFTKTSHDFHPDSEAARMFFATCQNLFHYAVTRQTAAEIIRTRCDHTKHNVGMTALPDIIPDLLNVTVAKNYLNGAELKKLRNICEQFILFAESRALEKRSMTMNEWLDKLKELIRINDYPLLDGHGIVSRQDANQHAHGELRKYTRRLRGQTVTASISGA